MDPGLAILITGVLIAIACALPGVFLMLRRQSMLIEAISHAVLPGIASAYVLARGPNLPAGLFGAAISALLAVTLIELLRASGRVADDSAMGLVLSTLFAAGVIIATQSASGSRFDPDAVLFGNIEFAALEPPIVLAGVDLGPTSVWTAGALLAANLAFVGVAYKELALSTFDVGLAAALGFSPALLHYALMITTSLTTVGAFGAVGAVLVIALMIAPAATAFLLTDDLKRMLALAAGLGALAAILGYGLARLIDASVSGSIVTMLGVQFLIAVLVTPGDVAIGRRTPSVTHQNM